MCDVTFVLSLKTESFSIRRSKTIPVEATPTEVVVPNPVITPKSPAKNTNCYLHQSSDAGGPMRTEVETLESIVLHQKK